MVDDGMLSALSRRSPKGEGGSLSALVAVLVHRFHGFHSFHRFFDSTQSLTLISKNVVEADGASIKLSLLRCIVSPHSSQKEITANYAALPDKTQGRRSLIAETHRRRQGYHCLQCIKKVCSEP